MTKVDINLTAHGTAVNEPWIWHLCREYAVKVTIVKANIDTDFGSMRLELEGSVEEIQRAVAWLMTTGMHVESEQRAVGA